MCYFPPIRRLCRLPAALAVVLFSLLSSAAGADEPTPSTAPAAEQIGRWIEDLANDDFSLRQAASQKLLAAGLPARDALIKLSEGPDPETRASARRLIALIETTEFRRSLDAFAADTEGKQEVKLPGWDVYRKLVGDDRPARALFVEMHRQEATLIAAMFSDRSAAREAAWEERVMQLVQVLAMNEGRNVSPPLASCATMILLGAAPEAAASDRAASLLINLIQRQAIRDAMQAGAHRDAFRRLVAGWIVNCPNKEESVLQQRLGLATSFNLSEALPLALAVAGTGPEYSKIAPSTRVAAVMLVGQTGRREHVAKLEHLLEDQSICGRTSVMTTTGNRSTRTAATIQVRDVALVMMLQLTGQKPADYGYVAVQRQPEQLNDISKFYVKSDAERTAAIAKWRAWKAQNTQPPDEDK